MFPSHDPKGFSLAFNSKGANVFGDVINSGTKATNVIADPSTPVAHDQTIIISVGGSTATQVYAALAHLINQLDDVSAAADGGTSVTITADRAAESVYDIVVTGTYIVGGHASSTPTNGADSDDFAGAFVKGNAAMPYHGGDTNVFAKLPTNYSASFRFPSLAEALVLKEALLANTKYIMEFVQRLLLLQQEMIQDMWIT